MSNDFGKLNGSYYKTDLLQKDSNLAWGDVHWTQRTQCEIFYFDLRC